MNLKRILDVVHLVLAALYLYFVLFGKWAKRGDPDLGAFSSEGGAGFGIIAVVLGVALVVLALMRIAGKSKVLPGLGVEQLTVVFGLSAVVNLIAYVVGWLAVFPTGTGWAIPAAYFPASLIPQIGLLTVALAEPGQGIKPLETGKRQAFSLIALLAGIGVAFFPFLTWLSSGSVNLAGFDSRAGNPTSGPRLSYFLLAFGIVIAVAALMRMRPRGLAEPGPNLLHSHALLTLGLVTLLLPLATLISVFMRDGLDPGIGLWLGLIAGLVLVGTALVENRTRGAVAA